MIHLSRVGGGTIKTANFSYFGWWVTISRWPYLSDLHISPNSLSRGAPWAGEVGLIIFGTWLFCGLQLAKVDLSSDPFGRVDYSLAAVGRRSFRESSPEFSEEDIAARVHVWQQSPHRGNIDKFFGQ